MLVHALALARPARRALALVVACAALAPASAVPALAAPSAPASAARPAHPTAPTGVEAGLWRTPRYGVEAGVPAGLWRSPRYGAGAPTGLWRSPRYGVPGSAPTGLWRSPRYGVPASAPTGLWRSPRYGVQAPSPAGDSRADTPANRLLGRNRSATPWFSGAWTGGHTSMERAEVFGRWRGTPLDAVTTYPDLSTWDSLADSRWHITTYADFPGRLVYGLPLLPKQGPGTLADVAAGRYDHVFRAIARDLRQTGRGDAIVRIGFEGNGVWTRYGGTAANAATWRAAYRRVATVLRQTAPKLVRNFDITCGFAMPGSRDRLDSLTKLYPGDDVVDLVGCDMYDEHWTQARTASQWRMAVRPWYSPGIADVAAFARAHGKGMSIPEWGVAGTNRGGTGDNPFWVRQMRAWMRANADVLVLENYFNDRARTIRSDLWRGQNPAAAAVYRELW